MILNIIFVCTLVSEVNFQIIPQIYVYRHVLTSYLYRLSIISVITIPVDASYFVLRVVLPKMILEDVWPNVHQVAMQITIPEDVWQIVLELSILLLTLPLTVV